MKKLAVEKINKTYTFPLPGSKSRISVKYTRPQAHEGSISVVVSGWITTEDKTQFPFTGTLVKSFGTNFKDVGKDLTESLEQANEKAGNPIQDAYGFVNSKIVPSVPYDAMDDFFKGIKQRKTTKNKPTGQPNNKPTENPQDKGMYSILPPKTQVIIDYQKMYNDNEKIFNELRTKNPDIVDKPYGIIHQDNGKEAYVIFENKSYEKIPRKYIKELGEKFKEGKNDKGDFGNALAYYERYKKQDDAINFLNPSLIIAVLNYKKTRKQLDEYDNKLFELATKKIEDSQKPKEEPKSTNIFKNIFKKKV